MTIKLPPHEKPVGWVVIEISNGDVLGIRYSVLKVDAMEHAAQCGIENSDQNFKDIAYMLEESGVFRSDEYSVWVQAIFRSE